MLEAVTTAKTFGVTLIPLKHQEGKKDEIRIF
jgi:hypothetical protein